MVDYSDLIARLRAADCWDAHYYDKGFGTARNVSAPDEAATALEALSARERVLREALVGLSLAAGKLNVALDGQAKYRGHRRAVLSAMERACTALANQDGGEKL